MVAFKSFLLLGIIGYEHAFMPLGRLNCALTPRMKDHEHSQFSYEYHATSKFPYLHLYLIDERRSRSAWNSEPNPSALSILVQKHVWRDRLPLCGEINEDRFFWVVLQFLRVF